MINDISTWFDENPIWSWTLQTTFYLVLVIVVVVISRRFVIGLLKTDGKDHKKQTVFPILKEILYALIYFFAFCVVLEIFGVSTTPIWTVASAVSVAIGFGAQQVVKDIFSGFLLILEGQFVVGDMVEINGMMGEVETISLRVTEIRDGVDGSLHIISNGEIRTVTNLSKKYMIAVVDLPIDYDEDIDAVLNYLNEFAKAYPTTNKLKGSISILGVREFTDRSLRVRAICKTKVGQNWAVERDLRRYFKVELEKKGIIMPQAIKNIPEEK